MTSRLTRKAVLVGFAAAAASASARAEPAPRTAAKIERDSQGRIIAWTGADGTRYEAEYRSDFPAFRLAEYPGVAAYAFKRVTATGPQGAKSAAFSGFAWGPDKKPLGGALRHAGETPRGVFVQNGFDSSEAMARAARGRLRALHLWTEQDFLNGVADALKLNSL